MRTRLQPEDEEVAALPPDESAAPPVSLEGDPRGADWMGLTWRSADVASPGRDDVGVYRIVGSPWGRLDYLGQGAIATRWRTHAAGWTYDLGRPQSRNHRLRVGAVS